MADSNLTRALREKGYANYHEFENQHGLVSGVVSQLRTGEKPYHVRARQRVAEILGKTKQELWPERYPDLPATPLAETVVPKLETTVVSPELSGVTLEVLEPRREGVTVLNMVQARGYKTWGEFSTFIGVTPKVLSSLNTGKWPCHEVARRKVAGFLGMLVQDLWPEYYMRREVEQVERRNTAHAMAEELAATFKSTEGVSSDDAMDSHVGSWLTFAHSIAPAPRCVALTADSPATIGAATPEEAGATAGTPLLPERPLPLPETEPAADAAKPMGAVLSPLIAVDFSDGDNPCRPYPVPKVWRRAVLLDSVIMLLTEDFEWLSWCLELDQNDADRLSQACKLEHSTPHCVEQLALELLEERKDDLVALVSYRHPRGDYARMVCYSSNQEGV